MIMASRIHQCIHSLVHSSVAMDRIYVYITVLFCIMGMKLQDQTNIAELNRAVIRGLYLVLTCRMKVCVCV